MLTRRSLAEATLQRMADELKGELNPYITPMTERLPEENSMAKTEKLVLQLKMAVPTTKATPKTKRDNRA